MDGASSINADLGAPYSGSLINVNGNVTLNGSINVTQLPGFGVGVYRIVSYQGTGMTTGLTLANASPTFSLQTGLAGQINVLNQSQANEIQIWQGSSGTWNGTNANWANATTLAAEAWGGRFGVFQGPVSTVTVDATSNLQFQGLQFSTDGYIVSGGTLTAVNGSDGVTTLRVEPNVTATLGSTLAGTDVTLAKRDAGTLILTGANTYTGTTRLEGGVLQINDDTQLGATANGVAFAGGTLRYAGAANGSTGRTWTCLLYTSDAADE